MPKIAIDEQSGYVSLCTIRVVARLMMTSATSTIIASLIHSDPKPMSHRMPQKSRTPVYTAVPVPLYLVRDHPQVYRCTIDTSHD